MSVEDAIKFAESVQAGEEFDDGVLISDDDGPSAGMRRTIVDDPRGGKVVQEEIRHDTQILRGLGTTRVVCSCGRTSGSAWLPSRHHAEAWAQDHINGNVWAKGEER
jgi:hypothetical protein